MFALCKEFNQPLDQWNVSSVTKMNNMFSNCEKFNQPLDQWNVSSVNKMNNMFYECKEFNQPLDQWTVSSVTNMDIMFQGCKEFNQPLDQWNVSSVTTMSFMFKNCEKFNQPLDQWNVSSVTNMSNMFFGCVQFNQPLDQWNVSSVTNMSFMFKNCEKFNQPLNNWTVSSVTNMSFMFEGCIQFNQPLNNWNVTNANLTVNSMRNIFNRCGPIAQNNIQLWVRAIPPPPPPPPQGMEYEIHNAFNQHYALNKNKYFEIIGLPSQTDSTYYTSLPNIVEYIKPKLIELIRNVYPAEEITKKIEEMNQILHKIYLAQELSEKPDTKLLLGKTVDFLVTQSNEFVHFYLEALKYDCLNASGTNRSSCVKGMIERFYLTMGDTAYALCPDSDTCNNPKYNELVSLFNKRVDKNELTQEWNRTFLEDPVKRDELLKLDKPKRQDHYRQFMIQKYIDAGQISNEQAKQMVLRDIIEPEIIALDYVFEGLQFGGTEKNKSRKNNSRKNNSRKNKSKKNKSRKNKSKKNKSRKNKSNKQYK